MIAIGSDHLGYDLKVALKKFIEDDLKMECVDVGVRSHRAVDYPDIAIRVTDKVRDGSCRCGILICGTGIGMAIAANKVPGIYAAVCHDPYSAERARRSNDTNVMCMGALVVGPELAKTLVGIWISSEFQGGNSARKVGKIIAIEEQYVDRKMENETGFYRVVALPDYPAPVGNESIRFWPALARYTIGGETEVGFCTCHERAREIVSLERHLNTPEILVPVDNDFMLPVAAADQRETDGGALKSEDIEMVRVSLGTAIILGPGVWHWAVWPEKGKSVTYLVEFKSGTPKGDVEIKDLEDKVRF